uniref:Zinc knuckle CX2CX4HX4C domain-containing protein n=1 Tax=Fagus sylvatica TaxID=28930 RepID=A0A2N9GMN7_FAGSY
MDDVLGLWERFSLTDKEEVPFDFGPVDEIHNLPIRHMNHDYAKVLGKVLGLVEQVAESEEARGCEGCMRIRIKMDISKPLCRGRKARLSARNETWIAFRYERLPNFCYWCAVVKLIRRVEVKVAGRSNAPRWDRRFNPMNDRDIPVASHGGDGVAMGDGGPNMDFTKMKENLPQFSEDPKIVVDSSEQTFSVSKSAKKSTVTPEDLGVNNEHINQEVELIVDSQDVVLGKESEGAKPRVFLQEVSRMEFGSDY